MVYHFDFEALSIFWPWLKRLHKVKVRGNPDFRQQNVPMGLEPQSGFNLKISER
jgi:hypothetical protein